MTRCPWCADPNAEDVDNPELLCPMHLAEHEGLPLAQMQRRDAIQDAEYAEWVLGQ